MLLPILFINEATIMSILRLSSLSIAAITFSSIFITPLATAGIENIATKGATLPYQILRDDIKDNAKTGHMIEIRNGGYGSDMTGHPSKANQFYALTDRGPNAAFTDKTYGKGKIFPTPNYTPRIGLFEVTDNGSIKQLKTILLKRPDGTLITGLPNNADMGGTGETPFNIDGKPIVEDMSKAFDKNTNPIKLDNFGLDGEGLAALEDGTFWVSDEYGPHIVQFDKNGVEIQRINAFTNDSRGDIKLPAEFSKRRANRGMEGLAITPDQQTLIGTMQSTIYNPDKAVKDLDLVRLVTVELATGKIGQYLYKQQKNQNSNSGIAALSNTEFMVIERDGAFLANNNAAMKHLYRIDLSTATNLEELELTQGLTQHPTLGLTINGQTLEQAVLTHGWGILTKHNIVPVAKKRVVDLVKTLQYPHDKLEGMWLINPTTIGVINDDDFATWASKGKLEQKYLDKEQTVIDANVLYVIDNLNLK